MKISAILLCHDCADYVIDAVRSVLNQDVDQTMEVIVSDDASRDATHELVQREIQAYRGPHQVRLLRRASNSGSKSAHLNDVFPMARGDVLISFDSDDIAEPQRVRRILSAFVRDSRVRAVYSAVSVIDNRGQPRGSGRVPHPPPGYDPRRWFARVDAYASGATLAIHREVVDSFPPLDPAIHEDVVLPFRASLLGEVSFIDEPLVRYRRHGASLTADFSRFDSLDAFRKRMLDGIGRARTHLDNRLEDIGTMRRRRPGESAEWDELERVARRSMEHAELTAPLFSPRFAERWIGLVRVVAAGAYPQDLAQNAAIALAPRSYLRFKRRRLSLARPQD